MAERDDVARLAEAHYDRVYRLARVMAGNEADAGDLAQETFLAAVRGLPGFRGESSVGTWLVAILRRRFADLLRRRAVRESAPMPAVPAADSAGTLEGGPDVGAALAALSEPVRTTLVLFYYENMDYAAIAEVLDCPVGTVRSRLHEGRAQMRRLLAPAVGAGNA